MATLGDTATDVTACLLAGRRAYLAEGQTLALTAPKVTYAGKEPEEMAIGDPVYFNNINITPLIDAVVIETIVRLEHPDRPRSKPRPWWKFWR